MRFQRKIRHTLIGAAFSVLSLQVMIGFSFAGTVGLPIAFGQEKGFTTVRLDYERRSPEIESTRSPFRGNSREERLLLSAGYAPSHFLEFKLKLGLIAFETPSRKFNGSPGPAYGIGAKWTFYQKDFLSVGMGLSVLTFNTEDSASVASSLKWDEVEAFIGGTLGGFKQMTPYFGLLFSESSGKFENGAKVKQKGFAGLFFGAAFRVTDRVHFLSEARMIRENSFSLSLRVQL